MLATAVPGSGPEALEAICWADERAESPPESLVRVQLRRRGLVPVPQFVVRNANGGFVARVDLAFPEQRVAVEYDGAWHAEQGQFAKDRRRLNACWRPGGASSTSRRPTSAPPMPWLPASAPCWLSEPPAPTSADAPADATARLRGSRPLDAHGEGENP